MTKKSNVGKEGLSLRSGVSSTLKITEQCFRLGDIAKGYTDNSENEEGGVFTQDGSINIRPRFQRANVTSTNKNWLTALIDSVLNGLPISIMYFGKVTGMPYDKIVIDGQQRLMGLCSFINNDFSVKVDGKDMTFGMLPTEWRDRILNYTLKVNLCEGSEEDMVDWFTIINQPLAILTQQELRNAAFCGEWCEVAKRVFSAVKSGAKPTSYNGFIMDKNSRYHYDNYTMKKEPNRQDLLELALDWITLETARYDADGDEIPMDSRIRSYMFNHKDDTNADELINHYKRVIDWAYEIFGEGIKQKCAKNVEWGRLYATYHNNKYDIGAVRAEAEELFMDEDVTANSAVYEYVLMDKEVRKSSMLVLRAFSNIEKQKMYKMQKGICPIDGKKYKIEDMEAHHIIPWEKGGKTELANGVLIAKTNHKDKHAEIEGILELRNEKFPSYLDS